MNIKRAAAAWPILLLAGLAGCGGSEDELELASSSPENLARVTGTVAVGVPVANAHLDVRCAAGAPFSVAADANGAFGFVPPGGYQAPCVLRASLGTVDGTANAQDLYSVLPSFGHVNVTPLTDLLVARVAAEDPAAFFDAFAESNRSAKVSRSTAQAAAGDLTQYLGDVLGLDTAPLEGFDLLTDPFVPAAGDSHDALLEALAAGLAAQSLTLAQARTALTTYTVPPCSTATAFCWPVTAYKLLTENRLNDKGEPEAKFHEHDVDITVNSDGSWTKTLTLKADKIGKIPNFDITRTPSFTTAFRHDQPGDCGYAISAGESCHEALFAAMVMVCGPAAGDDFVLMPAAAVQKDSADEIKKEAAGPMHGLVFDRIVGCAKADTTFSIDAAGNVTDETGALLGPISSNIGKNATKTLERKFWKLSSGTQTRFFGIETGTKNGSAYFAVLVSR